MGDGFPFVCWMPETSNPRTIKHKMDVFILFPENIKLKAEKRLNNYIVRHNIYFIILPSYKQNKYRIKIE